MDLCGEEVTDKGLLKLHKQTRGKKKKNKTEFKKIGQITLNFLVKRLFECWPQGQARAGSGQWGGGQRAVHPGEGGT